MVVKLHIVLNSALYAVKRSASHSGRNGAPRIHWRGDWVGPRAGSDVVAMKKFLSASRTEPRSYIPSVITLLTEALAFKLH
jgi:hypothetical protein